MTEEKKKNITCAILSGIFLALASSNENWGFVVFIGIIPLLHALDNSESPFERFLLGFLTGVIHLEISAIWVANYSIYGWLLCSLSAIPYGIFGIIGNKKTPLETGVYWALAELCRKSIPPLGCLPLAISCDFLPVLRLAPLGGEFLINLVIASISAILYKLPTKKIPKETWLLSIPFFLTFTQSPPKNGPILKVGVLQTNERNSDETFLDWAFEQKEADIILWPEILYSDPVHNVPLQNRFATLSKTADVFVGHNLYENQTKYNALTAFQWNPEFSIQSYKKENPVPITEETFAAGKKNTPFKKGELLLGTIICIEEHYSACARKQALQGAAILLAPSNSQYYTKSGIRQQKNAGRLRALETQLPLLHATNCGESAIILGNGNIVAQTKETKLLTANIPISLHPPKTLLTQWGEPILALGWSLLMLLPKILKRKKK
jgi:apolipoprotein N-acyltransferase